MTQTDGERGGTLLSNMRIKTNRTGRMEAEKDGGEEPPSLHITLPSGAPLKLRRSETLDMNIINIFSSCVRINILILSVRMIVSGDVKTTRRVRSASRVFLFPPYGSLRRDPLGFKGTVRSFGSQFAPSSHINNNWSSRSSAAAGR